MNIRHNISALNTTRHLSNTNRGILKNTENLSTSLRLNRAADDSAGLSISEKMRAQISGLSKAAQNTQDSISLIQTGEGALAEINSMLIRGRELAVQAANDTNTDDDRQLLNQEIQQLFEEIDRVGRDTEFNTMKLFDGSTKSLTLQLGANQQQNQIVSFQEVSVDTLALTNVTITTQQQADEAIVKLDRAAVTIASQRSQLGAWQNGFEHNSTNRKNTGDNLSSAESVIRDANMAFEVMGLTKNQILRDTMQSALGQANMKSNQVLNLLTS